MAPSLVKVAVFFFFGGLTSAIPNINHQLDKRGLIVATKATLPDKWSSYGCYLDGASTGRTLPLASYSNATSMTEESCVTFCNAQGFNYAGVEYGDQCYCGNSLSPKTVEPATDCNMACAGNASEACGGSDRLNVFWSGKAPPPSPVTNPGPPGWTFVGCYQEGTTGRILTEGVPVTGGPNDMTVAACTYACNQAGFIYAGVEYAQECYCGNSFANGGTIAPGGISDCSYTCLGNSSEYCGASNLLDVYELSSLVTSKPKTTAKTTSKTTSKTTAKTTTAKTTTAKTTSKKTSTTAKTTAKTTGKTTTTSKASTTSKKSSSTSATPTGPVHVKTVGGYSWIGCYTEGTGVRALKDAQLIDYTAMTVEECESYCSAPTVYTYFGVEYSGECYCGNVLQAGSDLAPTTDCDMICDGSPYEYCGAGNRLDVYQLGSNGVSTYSTATKPTKTGTSSISAGTGSATGLPAGWKYDGCYIDGADGRILRYGQPDSQTNTIESCVNTCAGLGYTVAGMEFSTQCFCDNQVYNGGVKTTNTDCNMACAGNSAEMCGAGNRMSIYNTGALTVYAPPAPQQSGIPGSWHYQGCYTDNVNQTRALFWQMILTNNNTASNCLGLCQEYGYMSGGMEYGDECYCGDNSALVASGSTLRPDSECTTPCSGDPTYICGDGNRLSYYVWNGTALYNWNKPTGNAAGVYEFFIGGVVVPLMTSLAINNKVTFLEKHGTGAPNTTGAYELDLSLANDFDEAWREMHLKTDVFCSGGLTLPDKGGRQLTIGGWSGDSTYGVRLYWPDGTQGVNGTNDWQENVNELTLLTGRWYPSAMIMSNGSILVMGGEVGSNSAANPTLEILPLPAGGYAKYLDWLARTDPNNLYPFCFVLPQTGGIFVGYWNEARILDPVTFDTRTTLPNIPGSVSNFLAGRTYPLEGTAVMLPQHAPYTDPATMLICGGSANGDALAIDNCVSIQPEVPKTNWTIERMPSQRVMTCICALPDGTYLILNGAQEGVAGFGLATDPNLGAVLYDPTQAVGSRMSIMATTIVARLYHSEAILLPDGSVLVSGSDPQDGTHPEEYRVEKFLPPYMLNNLAKPTYKFLDSTDWSYGGNYRIQITSGTPSKISLMGAVSSTHGNSMGQKTLFPAFSCADGICTITAPPNNWVAPPGWFQVFVLDGPTPSVSQWVRIGGDPAKLGNWPNFPDFTVPGV